MTNNDETALENEIKKESLADARGWEDTALLPVNVQAVQDRVKQLMKDIGFPDSTAVYTAFMQLANEFSQGCFTDRPTAPRNAALGVDRQSVDQETVTNEMIAAALEESLAVMKEYNVDALSPFADYPPPSEVVKRAITAALKVRPTAPQNAEALGACDHIKEANNCHISVRGYYCFDPIHLDKIRAALNQPRTPKIDGLREAIDTVYTGYHKDGLDSSDMVSWYNEALSKVIKAARAQLAAQEGGVG